MEGEVIEDRYNSWFRTHPLNGYQTHEWEFKRCVVKEDYEIIYNPWGGGVGGGRWRGRGGGETGGWTRGRSCPVYEIVKRGRGRVSECV